MDWKNVEVVMAYSSRYWYTIVKRMRKTIWIAGVLIEIQTGCLPDTNEMCQNMWAILANPGGYSMSGTGMWCESSRNYGKRSH